MSEWNEPLIVTRHTATVEFVAKCLSSPTDTFRPSFLGADGRPKCIVSDSGRTANVLQSATADDIRGRVVYGNLPMHLAALAAEVWAVEFEGLPPRGQEYTLADMESAGARLCRYVVLGGDDAAGVSRVKAVLVELLREAVSCDNSARFGGADGRHAAWVADAARRMGLIVGDVGGGQPAPWLLSDVGVPESVEDVTDEEYRRVREAEMLGGPSGVGGPSY